MPAAASRGRSPSRSAFSLFTRTHSGGGAWEHEFFDHLVADLDPLFDGLVRHLQPDRAEPGDQVE